MNPMSRFLAGLLALLLLSLGSCNERGGLEGRYRAEALGGTPAQQVILELGSNGQGIWKSGGDQVSFKWEVRGAEVRLHTREGGVLAGRVGNNILDIQLPGMPSLTFTKMAR